jgi:DNA-binding transcriptional LysR family regulator
MPKKIEQFFYKNNRLQQLRGFCAVMQLKNLTRAAEHLKLSHTAISLQIKSLEDDLKIKLFTRNGPKIMPTKDAEKLYEIAIGHVEGINNIYDEFLAVKNHDNSDEIKIAANNASLNFVLPKILKPYLDENPNIYSRVVFAEQDDGLKKLANDEIDVLLIPRREHKPIDNKMFSYTPLFYYVPVLLTLPNHPLARKKKLSVHEIAEYDFTLPAKGLHVIPNLPEIFERYQINKRFRVKFEGWEITRKYIETGLVISITADVVVERNDVLCRTPLTHLFPNVDYGFVVKRGRRMEDKVMKLFDIAKKYQKEIQSDLVK